MPSIRIGTTLRVDDAPTMPHMFVSPSDSLAGCASLAERLRHDFARSSVGTPRPILMPQRASISRAQILVLALVPAVAFAEADCNRAFPAVGSSTTFRHAASASPVTAGAFLLDPLFLLAAGALGLLLRVAVGLRLRAAPLAAEYRGGQGKRPRPTRDRRFGEFISLSLGFFAGRFQPGTRPALPAPP